MVTARTAVMSGSVGVIPEGADTTAPPPRPPPPQVVGEGRCPIVDTWWQTETGGAMISPMPFAWKAKPGSATVGARATARPAPLLLLCCSLCRAGHPPPPLPAAGLRWGLKRVESELVPEASRTNAAARHAGGPAAQHAETQMAAPAGWPRLTTPPPIPSPPQLPFFGVEPALLDEKGREIHGPGQVIAGQLCVCVCVRARALVRAPLCSSV